MQPKIELVKTRDFGEIINDTFTFVSQNWKPLLKSYAIICGFFIVANLVVALLQQQKLVGAMQGLPVDRFGRFSSLFGPAYFLSLLFGVLALTSITLVPICFMTLYKEKGNIAPEVVEVWGYFKYYFFRTLGSYIILVIVFLVGFVLCLVPGFYLIPILSLVLPVIVFENSGLGHAWSKSFQLIKENWWQTFGAMIIITIVTYAAISIFVIPVSLLTVGTMFLSRTQPTSSSYILTTIISSLCYVFYMLPSITAVFCYFNLNEQKEGTGLMGRINNFSNPDTDLPKEEY